MYEKTIAALPFVDSIDIVPAGNPNWDELWTLSTAARSYRLFVVRKQGVPGQAALHALLSKPWAGADGKLLLCPRVTSGVAAKLRAASVNYCDSAGNLYLQLGDRYLASVEGKRHASTRDSTGGFKSAGYRVLGALLVEPDMLQSSLRACAAKTGTGHTTVAAVRDLLRAEGHLVVGPSGPRLVRGTDLLHRWARGYWDLLRPKLLVGRYALPGDSTDRLRDALDGALGDRWAWGGSQASFRHFSFGTAGDIVVHLLQAGPLPLRADEHGAVEALVLPFESAWSGRLRQSVHPVLSYAELRFRPDDRAQEVAASVEEHLLHHWGRGG